MLLTVILNVVLAVTVVGVMVALHTKAILADRAHRLSSPQRRRVRAPEYSPARPAPRATRQPVASL